MRNGITLIDSNTVITYESVIEANPTWQLIVSLLLNQISGRKSNTTDPSGVSKVFSLLLLLFLSLHFHFLDNEKSTKEFANEYVLVYFSWLCRAKKNWLIIYSIRRNLSQQPTHTSSFRHTKRVQERKIENQWTRQDTDGMNSFLFFFPSSSSLSLRHNLKKWSPRLL